MLRSPSEVRQDSSLRCLEMILFKEPTFWRPLYDHGVVAPLVELLRSHKRRPRSAASTVACISECERPRVGRTHVEAVYCGTDMKFRLKVFWLKNCDF